MADMSISHGWTTALADDPAYDVSADEMNTHVITFGDVLKLVPVAVDPAADATQGIFYIVNDGAQKSLRFKFPNDNDYVDLWTKLI